VSAAACRTVTASRASPATSATIIRTSATPATQFHVHVSQLVTKLATGDAVQEEVDGVVNVHELEADGAK